MAGFVFELEALLELRRRAERERQVAVAAIEAERVACAQRLDAGVRARTASLSARRALLRVGGGIDLRAVRHDASFAARLDAHIRLLEAELGEVMQRLEAAREQLRAAMTARKAVERLRERRLEAWKRRQARREALALDEITTARAARASARRGGDAAEVLT